MRVPILSFWVGPGLEEGRSVRTFHKKLPLKLSYWNKVSHPVWPGGSYFSQQHLLLSLLRDLLLENSNFLWHQPQSLCFFLLSLSLWPTGLLCPSLLPPRPLQSLWIWSRLLLAVFHIMHELQDTIVWGPDEPRQVLCSITAPGIQ